MYVRAISWLVEQLSLKFVSMFAAINTTVPTLCTSAVPTLNDLYTVGTEWLFAAKVRRRVALDMTALGWVSYRVVSSRVESSRVESCLIVPYCAV
jgi:hypothetical protein